jgi:NhaP-type Na+/H+ or K+/H+ antiporter
LVNSFFDELTRAFALRPARPSARHIGRSRLPELSCIEATSDRGAAHRCRRRRLDADRLDAVLPILGLKPAIRDLVGSINFSATLLNGFLAFLLFAGALQVNSADMFSRKWTILALATLATLLSTGLVAAALFAASRLLGLGISLPWCLVFGALISPTDPVSVLDVLKRVGIPRQLQATVAGESLFNDGIGVVVFALMLSLATGRQIDDFGGGTIASLFLIEAFGGGLLGLGLGYLAFLMIRRVDDYNVELIISLALASGTYSVAGLLGVSGPIAVVVAGLLIGNHGIDRAMSETTRQHGLRRNPWGQAESSQLDQQASRWKNTTVQPLPATRPPNLRSKPDASRRV